MLYLSSILATEAKKQEKGSVLVEYAIAIPILIIMAAGIIDVGRAISAYLELNRVAYEAGRYLTSQIGVEPPVGAKTNCFGDREDCSKVLSPAVDRTKTRAKNLLLESSLVSPTEIDMVEMVAEINTRTSPGKCDEEKNKSMPGCQKQKYYASFGNFTTKYYEIHLTIRAPFQPIFPFLNVGFLKATSVANYLYPDQ